MLKSGFERARVNRQREKAYDRAKISKSIPQGLKPTLILLAFYRG